MCCGNFYLSQVKLRIVFIYTGFARRYRTKLSVTALVKLKEKEVKLKKKNTACDCFSPAQHSARSRKKWKHALTAKNSQSVCSRCVLRVYVNWKTFKTAPTVQLLFFLFLLEQRYDHLPGDGKSLAMLSLLFTTQLCDSQSLDCFTRDVKMETSKFFPRKSVICRSWDLSLGQQPAVRGDLGPRCCGQCSWFRKMAPKGEQMYLRWPLVLKLNEKRPNHSKRKFLLHTHQLEANDCQQHEECEPSR